MLKKAAFVVSAIVWCAVVAQAQPSQLGCSPEELKNLLPPSDPAYADAIELAATLQNHGVTILCVLPSHFAQFLPRQTAAALFRTSIGDFEALFRSKEQNFDDILISEKREGTRSAWSNGAGYRYIFRNPQGIKLQDMAGRETFFMGHRNILFLTWKKNTATVLTESLGDVMHEGIRPK